MMRQILFLFFLIPTLACADARKQVISTDGRTCVVDANDSSKSILTNWSSDGNVTIYACSSSTDCNQIYSGSQETLLHRIVLRDVRVRDSWYIVQTLASYGAGFAPAIIHVASSAVGTG